MAYNRYPYHGRGQEQQDQPPPLPPKPPPEVVKASTLASSEFRLNPAPAVERRPIGPRPPQHQQLPVSRPPYPVDDNGGIPVPPKHTTPPRPPQHHQKILNSGFHYQPQPQPPPPPPRPDLRYEPPTYEERGSSNSSSPQSTAYSVNRTSSSNTAYSRSNDPVIHPDNYSVKSWELDEPVDDVPQGSVMSDEEEDDGDDAFPSFITGIKEELNAMPQRTTPVKREPEYDYSTPEPEPEAAPASVKVKIEQESPPTPPRIKRQSPPKLNSVSPGKLYNAYNRPNFIRGSSVQEKRYSHPVSVNYQHVAADGTATPQRMKTMGPSGYSNNANGSILNEGETLGIPQSQSTSTISPYLNASNTTNQSSLRSSSRSTDYALMNQLNLPTIPQSRQQFEAHKLSSRDFDRCEEVWSLQCLGEWIALFFSEQRDMRYEEVTKALTGLFTHHIPTLNPIRAERVSLQVLDTLVESGFLSYDEEHVITFKLDVEVCGVLPLMTGYGCYSNRCHDDDNLSTLRCYSPRCSRTLPLKRHEVNISELDDTTSNSDWAAYWNLDEEQVSELDKQLVKRQYAIHELIVGEESYVRDLTTLSDVFGKSLLAQNPPIMRKQREFWDDAFGPVQALVECNTKYLLTDFKHRQRERGPFIDGVADIILNWAKHAKDVYVHYADTYLLVDKRLRNERESNTSFANWFNQVSKDPRTRGTPHSFYFHRAIPRLARYSLLLGTIKKTTPSSHPEIELLDRAIAECDVITSLCNSRLEQVEKKVEIIDLKDQIRFKSNEEKVDLRLEDKKRKVIRRGDVTRRGDYRLDWIPTHLILLDNFLVISKIRKGLHGSEYYVTKKPIPLDLLVLESVEGEAVTKSSSSKLGVGTFTNNVSPTENKKMHLMPGGSPGNASKQQQPLPATPGGGGVDGMGSNAVTALGDPEKDVMFPFRVTHLGNGRPSFTFYAPSNMDRERWKEAIISAKQEYSSAIYALNAEPFRMRVLAGYAFGYEQSAAPRLPVFAPGTALDRALQEADESPNAKNIPRPLAKSRINCGVSFVFADGQEYTLLGMDYGVYVRSGQNGSIWRRCIDIYRVSQIDVIEELNVVVLLADKALVYYNLDTVLSQGAFKPNLNNSPCSTLSSATGSSPTPSGNSSSGPQIGGYKLSKHREVGFFVVGHMKDRSLLFYKRREGMSSTFKVIEPVKEKGSQRRRSKMVFSRGASIGSTEYFREVEKFYVPTEAYGINLFKSSFAVHTPRGFEVMSLDVKTPETVPVSSSYTTNTITGLSKASNNRKNFTTESLKKRIENAKPIGMFRVSEKSLILCYDELAVYTDNHGNLMGPCVIEFVAKAKDVALQHPYLLLFDDDMVEVRRVDKGGQLKQVISGKDIRAIDTKEGQIKIALAHPQLPARQLVVELINNEFVVEDDTNSLTGL